ncbi:RF-1 domain-containing protein [Fimicolochytrium jonesii]|uniref:RF-1 domain-containing protein n=1 Tax=Fimicolochytrium jonesii TaxID=1396493 RepID=UPI0022FF1CB8|nr:RF-1 domain-containing protein [Fimicolochytrium jonesii]KAI8824987.1 RF-1 domain-containing protein [Fimicolochytrium jonesii]
MAARWALPWGFPAGSLGQLGRRNIALSAPKAVFRPRNSQPPALAVSATYGRRVNSTAPSSGDGRVPPLPPAEGHYDSVSKEALPSATVTDALDTEHTPRPEPAAPRTRKEIVLLEQDLEEEFVKGSGPGGQKINKCRHRVQLKHIPTGLRVESQRFRDLTGNRKEARKLMTLKLDEHFNGELSKRQVKIAKERVKKKKMARKIRKKHGVGSGGSEVDDGEDDVLLEGDGDEWKEGSLTMGESGSEIKADGGRAGPTKHSDGKT